MSPQEWGWDWGSEDVGEDYITYDEYYNVYRSSGSYGYSELGKRWAAFPAQYWRAKCAQIMTPERKKKAVEEYLKGTPIEEIEIEIGAPRRCIYYALEEYGIQARRVLKRHSFRLTYAEKKTIEELYKQGKTISEIAKTIGRSYYVVWRYLVNAGLHKPKASPSASTKLGAKKPKTRRELEKEQTEMEKQIIEMYMQGVPVKEIRDTFRVSLQKIYNILEKHGVPKRKKQEGRRRRLSEEEIKKIIELHKQGYSLYKISKAIGRSVSTIAYVIRKYKHVGNDVEEPA